MPATADALNDLLELGRAYRRWALDHPTLYAVMFGARVVEVFGCERQDRAAVHGFVSLEIAQWSHSPRADRDALYEEHLDAVSSKWAV